MPEGDTVFRTAWFLRSLVGQPVTDARAWHRPGVRRVPDLSRVVGATVTSVEARGKHLLIGFDNGLTIRSHLRMTGSWRRFRPGERWARPMHQASAMIETTAAVAVAFNTPVVELLTDAELRRSRPLVTLGPDLLGPAFDADEGLRRLRLRNGVALGTALLDQGVVAGIGNVYKSELAFMAGLDPWSPVAAFVDDELRRLLNDARGLLQANVGRGPRSTTGRRGHGQALWVYGRGHRPCRRCGTPILARRQGDLARLTYWCPRCQAPPGGDAG
ncbi:MAG TPA: DNA-formamidopyrimidine glycosylase family protein [Candidatus Limnocylindria bacterium]